MPTTKETALTLLAHLRSYRSSLLSIRQSIDDNITHATHSLQPYTTWAPSLLRIDRTFLALLVSLDKLTAKLEEELP